MNQHQIEYSWNGLLTMVIYKQECRRLVYLIVLNMLFSLLELVYGLQYNCLSLVSDSVHMLFDCSALAIALYAQFVSCLSPDDRFTLGYGRYQVLAGFINALFLIFIAFFIILESLERLFHPPVIQVDHIIVVSILGFILNIIGLLFFHEHAHPSHNQCTHHHDHHSHSHNHNLEGVFLHILADALGSVGVLVSTFLIKYYDWQISDPICSFVISLLIVGSVVPLLKHCTKILMQSSPDGIVDRVSLENSIRDTPGVDHITRLQLWAITEEQPMLYLTVHTKQDHSQVRQALKESLGTYHGQKVVEVLGSA